MRRKTKRDEFADVDDEIVTTQVLEEQLDRELLSIDQIYVGYNTSMARDILQKK